MHDYEFLAKSKVLVKPEYFSARAYTTIYSVLTEFYNNYESLPTIDVIKLKSTEMLERGSAEEAGYLHLVEEIYNTELDEASRLFIEDELVTFCQRAEAAVAITTASKTIKSFDIDELAETLYQIQQIPTIFTDIGKSVRKDWMEIYEEDSTRIFPTGFPGIDRAMRGRGAEPGDLICFMGPAKVGKSTILGNIARGLFIMGELVVIYSLEMYTLDYMKRMLSCLTSVPINKIHNFDYNIQLHDTIKDLAYFTGGDLVIKEFPARMVNIEAIDAHMYMLKAKYGRTPVPVIDYADLLLGPRRVEEWRELNELYIQLRNLARRHQVPVFTASQTNASGFHSDDPDETHQAGSTRKAAQVDIMFGIGQNKVDYSMNRFRLRPFVNRNERKDLVSYWTARYDLCQINEVDEETFFASDNMEDTIGSRVQGQRASLEDV